MSGIYPRIFTRIDSLFRAGEGPLGFLTKRPANRRRRNGGAEMSLPLQKRPNIFDIGINKQTKEPNICLVIN